MYALGRTFVGADDNISRPRQANSVHGAAATAAQEAVQSTIKLPATGTVRAWLGYARPSRAPQSYAGMVG